MKMKQLAEKVAVIEKEIAAAQERATNAANVPQMATAGVALACEKEARLPSKAERRAKLIAAHVALAAIRHDLGDYAEYEAVNRTQNAIAAAIGRLELRD